MTHTPHDPGLIDLDCPRCARAAEVILATAADPLQLGESPAWSSGRTSTWTYTVDPARARRRCGTIAAACLAGCALLGLLAWWTR